MKKAMDAGEENFIEPKDPHHIVPFSTLRNVCLSLLALTILTVVTSRFHLGAFAGPVAFIIAFVKAMLVMMFFMGLKYDSKSNRIIFGASFFFLFLLFFFSAIDIFTRVFQNSTL